jgi:hypothetical protein
VILGAFFSEETLLRHSNSTALVDCPHCQRAHFPKVFECKAFVSANPPVNLTPFFKQLPKAQEKER